MPDATDRDGLWANMTSLIQRIQLLDPRACLRWSDYTQQWYVEANIEISDGVMVTGGTEHQDNPMAALRAFTDALQVVSVRQFDRAIVASPAGERRHYRWNGAGFVEFEFAALKSEAVGA